MVDTLRLTGSLAHYIRPFTFEKGYYFKDLDTGTEKLPVALVENRPGYWRVFYHPQTYTLNVELNPHKILFGLNIWNYEKRGPALLGLVRSVGAFFFGRAPYFLSRVDIGGVHTFETRDICRLALERYRATRLDGARTEKFKHQSYKDAVFYSTKNWSIKIYNKGKELKVHDTDTFYPFDLLATLRFEKTYRFRELGRLGMPVVPYKGIPINDVDFNLIMNDFFNVFQNWAFSASPWVVEKKGSLGLLSVIDSAGLLSEVSAMKTVSRQTVWRYTKEKKRIASIEVPPVTFADNLREKERKRWYFVTVAGVAGIFNQPLQPFS